MSSTQTLKLHLDLLCHVVDLLSLMTKNHVQAVVSVAVRLCERGLHCRESWGRYLRPSCSSLSSSRFLLEERCCAVPVPRQLILKGPIAHQSTKALVSSLTVIYTLK